MGLPNWLTILRILLIPVFVTLLVYRRAGWALLVFCLASFTDLLDGYIARTQGRQTRLGAFLDPMADKLLLTSGFVTLTWLKVLPFWITAVVVSRDVVLSLGVLVIHVAGGAVHPAPTWIGKLSTAFQMATVLAAMASVYFQLVPTSATEALAWMTAALTITSGLQYVIRGLRQQLETPTSVSGRL
jgi:cardiolipin synthase